MSKSKRGAARFIRRLETEFSSGSVSERGISSDLSGTGLFIRTRRALPPGSTLDVKLYLPDGQPSRLNCIVRRSTRTNSPLVKNGMGVEILQKDEAYDRFIKEHVTGSVIVSCLACGAKNRVPLEKLPSGPKCGKCKNPLSAKL